VEVVSLLLSVGAIVGIQDQVNSTEPVMMTTTFFTYVQSQWSSLHFACDGGHLEVVSVLLNAGAPVEVEEKVRIE
jgi:ankyrin repeat protein